MNTKTRIRITVIAIGLIVAAGCQNTHKQKKQEMEAKWQKTVSEKKLLAAIEQFEAGQYEQAGMVAQECIDAGLNLPEAYLLLGKVKLADGDFYQARDCFQNCVHLRQDSDEGWFLLGSACEGLKDNDSALAWYEKALELVPNGTDYVIAVGRMYVAQNDFIMAEKLYTEKILANPLNTDLKVAAAQMYLAWEQNDKAVQLYEEAHLIHPENNKLLEALGNCYIIAADWQKASEIHRQLYQRSTDEAEKNRYLRIMAFTAANAGDYSSAMKYYSQLTAQDKTNAELWFSMGQAALGVGATARAAECGRKALSLQPGLAEAIALVGCAQYVNGDYTAAITEFEKIATDDKYGAFSWLMRARCYSRLGKVVRANLAYQKALEMNPNSELGRFLARQVEEVPLLSEGRGRLTN